MEVDDEIFSVRFEHHFQRELSDIQYNQSVDKFLEPQRASRANEANSDGLSKSERWKAWKMFSKDKSVQENQKNKCVGSCPVYGGD